MKVFESPVIRKKKGAQVEKKEGGGDTTGKEGISKTNLGMERQSAFQDLHLRDSEPRMSQIHTVQNFLRDNALESKISEKGELPEDGK